MNSELKVEEASPPHLMRQNDIPLFLRTNKWVTSLRPQGKPNTEISKPRTKESRSVSVVSSSPFLHLAKPRTKGPLPRSLDLRARAQWNSRDELGTPRHGFYLSSASELDKAIEVLFWLLNQSHWGLGFASDGPGGTEVVPAIKPSKPSNLTLCTLFSPCSVCFCVTLST